MTSSVKQPTRFVCTNLKCKTLTIREGDKCPDCGTVGTHLTIDERLKIFLGKIDNDKEVNLVLKAIIKKGTTAQVLDAIEKKADKDYDESQVEEIG